MSRFWKKVALPKWWCVSEAVADCRCRSESKDEPSSTVMMTAIRSAIGMMFAMGVVLPGLAGCETVERVDADANTVNAPADRVADSRPISPRHAAALEEVERQYVIGPRSARELGYRIDWQHPNAGRSARMVRVEGDSVFLLDHDNLLIRLMREDGERIWRLPVAETIMEIFGLNYIGNRVYLTAGSSILVLDVESGSQIDRQRLDKVANTQPVQYGQFLVYGSRNGQVNWHSYGIAYSWRAYQIAQTIHVDPVRHEDSIIAVGGDGTIAVLDGARATMRWNRRLLGPVVAKPSAGHGAAVFAGTDQHIWAYDIYSGRNIWRRLTKSSLTTSPTVIRDRVYQYVPGKGIKCFETYPFDEPDGVHVWTTEGVAAEVVGQRGNRLLVWDPDGKVFSVLDARRGGVVTQVELPQVHKLIVPTLEAVEIFAVSDDGRVSRLVAAN